MVKKIFTDLTECRNHEESKHLKQASEQDLRYASVLPETMRLRLTPSHTSLGAKKQF